MKKAKKIKRNIINRVVEETKCLVSKRDRKIIDISIEETINFLSESINNKAFEKKLTIWQKLNNALLRLKHICKNCGIWQLLRKTGK